MHTPKNRRLHLPKVRKIPSCCPAPSHCRLIISIFSLNSATSEFKALRTRFIRRLNRASEASSSPPSLNTASSESRVSSLLGSSSVKSSLLKATLLNLLERETASPSDELLCRGVIFLIWSHTNDNSETNSLAWGVDVAYRVILSIKLEIYRLFASVLDNPL